MNAPETPRLTALALLLAAMPVLCGQTPPTPPEAAAAAEPPTPGAGQARREVQPPAGPSDPAGTFEPVRPENDLPGAQPQPGGRFSMADPRLPQLGVGTLNIDALAAGGVDAALDPRTAITTLQLTPRSEQDAALADLRTRVDATRRALIELRARARAQGLEVDADLRARLEADLENQEDALKRTLATAPVAQTDDDWRRLQSEISLQYEAFANAVRRVQLHLQATEPQLRSEP